MEKSVGWKGIVEWNHQFLSLTIRQRLHYLLKETPRLRVWCRRAEERWERWLLSRKKNYDIVILDIMMPNMKDTGSGIYYGKTSVFGCHEMTAFEIIPWLKMHGKRSKRIFIEALDFTELVSRINAYSVCVIRNIVFQISGISGSPQCCSMYTGRSSIHSY